MPRPKKQHLKQRKDGRYCCRYHGLQFMGATEDEALEAREEYKRLVAAGAFAPENIRFAEYGAKWVKAYKSHLTDGPYNTHVRMLNRWLEKNGNQLMTEITSTDVISYYQMFSGMSASTLNSARDTIKGVFKAALADGIIQKDPAANVKPPRGTKGTHREITLEERHLIHATDHRLRLPVLVMLYTGLRRGEVMALDIDRDVDFNKMELTVNEAIRFDETGKPMIVDPKTEAGHRTIPMLEGLANELQGHHGMLCLSAKGIRMTESAWSRAWESYLYALGKTKNGCPKRWAKSVWKPVEIRPHDLRHSFCTMLYDSGVDLKTAMRWMGHADQTMTMRIYTHLTETRQKEAENALRIAQKDTFHMQNDMQKLTQATEPLINKDL